MRHRKAGIGHAGKHGFRRRRGRGVEGHGLRERALVLGLGVEQRRHDDRRAAQMGDAVIGDRIIHRLRPHPAQADMRAGLHGERPREAPAIAVEHRQRPQIDGVPAHAGMDRVGIGHQGRAAMVVDDAFRVACRARRVVERDRVPFVVRHRPFEVGIARRDEILIVDRADPLAFRVGRILGVVQVVIVDDQRLHLCQRERLLGDARELAVDDQHFRFGMVELKGDDRSVEPRVEAECSTALTIGTPKWASSIAGELASMTVTVSPLPTPFLRQRRGKLQRAPPEIAVGNAPGAMDDRHVVGKHLRRAFEEGDRRQRQVIRRILVEIRSRKDLP